MGNRKYPAYNSWPGPGQYFTNGVYGVGLPSARPGNTTPATNAKPQNQLGNIPTNAHFQLWSYHHNNGLYAFSPQVHTWRQLVARVMAQARSSPTATGAALFITFTTHDT
jgi:hypothetical protein